MDNDRELLSALRECRKALDDLIRLRPGIQGLQCGSTTLGNLRVEVGRLVDSRAAAAMADEEDPTP